MARRPTWKDVPRRKDGTFDKRGPRDNGATGETSLLLTIGSVVVGVMIGLLFGRNRDDQPK